MRKTKTDAAAVDLTKPLMPVECTCAGVYLCIKAYGEVNLTYALRATLSDCPADFSAAGQQLLCSSPVDGDASQQRYTQCAADGTCVCKPPYDKPVEDVYPCEQLLSIPLMSVATVPRRLQAPLSDVFDGLSSYTCASHGQTQLQRLQKHRQQFQTRSGLKNCFHVQCWALRTAQPRLRPSPAPSCLWRSPGASSTRCWAPRPGPSTALMSP